MRYLLLSLALILIAASPVGSPVKSPVSSAVVSDASAAAGIPALDVSTLTRTAAKQLNISGECTTPTGVDWGDSGDKMYVSCNAGTHADAVLQYNCSTAYNPSTCTYNSKCDVSAQTANPLDLEIIESGDTLSISTNEDDVVTYPLSTTWGVSTCGTAEVQDVSSSSTNPRGISWSADGTKVFFSNTTGGSVALHEWSCSTPYTATSCTAVDSITPNGTGTTQGMDFTADGLTLIGADTSDSRIYQYACSAAFDISSCSYDSKELNPAVSSALGVAINVSDNSSVTVANNAATDTIEIYE
jgi:uncharacterized protein (UPF0333 family)